MRKHLVLLIAKYCRLLSAANRLKCGKKVKGSIMSTLNKLRASLARLDAFAASLAECNRKDWLTGMYVIIKSLPGVTAALVVLKAIPKPIRKLI